MRFVRTAENLFGLPLGFTRVEYLQSTGTQYIDTGFVPTSDNFQFEIRMLSQNTSAYLGYRSVNSGTATGDMRWFFNYSDGRVAIRYGDTTENSTLSFNTQTTHRFYFNGSSLYVDDVNYLTTTRKYATPVYKSFYLFSVNASGYYSADIASFVGRIYYTKIWDNDVLVRDFIPCIDQLGVPCMYDLVGKKPYYNQGTGTFTVGRQIIPVEYLGSTGTQYIDTGVGGDLTTELTCEAAIVQAGNASVTNIMGNNVTSSRAITINMSANIANPSPSRIRFGNTDNTTEAGAVNLNTFYKYDTNKNELTVRDSSGTVLNTYPLNATTAFTTNGNILIYKLGDTSTQYIGNIKVKGATIKNSGVLVRDFIPCKDENNVGFMFDKVSGTVYLNNGTGAFSVGENKYTSKLRLIKDAKELPDGYKRVEYLQSDGNQYIDTEYTINTATDEVLFNFQMISTTLYQWIMGEHDNGARFGVGVGDGANKRNIAYGSTTYKVNDTEIYNSIHYFVANSNGVYLNGTQVHGFESFSSSSTVYLFKLNLSGANGAAGKIWRYTQKRNGILIRDMIPCLDPNNTPCMVDLVSGGTYYNQGTGDFTYGHIITPVEYLESTGTQYIDTGIKLDNNSSVELDYQLTQAVQNRKGLFGGLGSSASKRFGALLSPSNSQLESGYGSANEFYQLGLPDTNRHVLKQEKNLLYFDGSLVYTFNTATFAHDFNAPLGNFSFTNYNPASAKYYRSKWWDNGTLVRSFIPVRDENNVGYMFDEVTGQLFGNAGSGSFGIGNDLKKAKVRFIQDVIPSAYLPLKYLQSTGTQYIDTGFKMLNDNMTFNGNIMWTQSNGNANFFYGYRSVNSAEYRGDMRAFFIYGASPAGRLAIRYGVNADNSTSVAVSLNQKYNISWDGDNLKVNGTTFASLSSAYTPANYQNIYLFWCNCTGYYSADVDKFSGRIYNWQIKQDGILVRDLYPALRKSDNKPGMYDRITKQFFVNQGTGEFNYG